MLRKRGLCHGHGRIPGSLRELGWGRDWSLAVCWSEPGSRSSFREPLDVFVQPEIVGLFGGKAAIDLQAFLRVPLRDVELRQHLSIGDIPGDFYRQRASCTG